MTDEVVGQSGKCGGRATVSRHSGMTAGILPNEAKVWQFELGGKPERLCLRIPNPMPGGKALGFANKAQHGGRLILKK